MATNELLNKTGFRDIPTFKTVADAVVAVDKKNRQEAADLYPRDGTLGLLQLEKRVGELIGVSDKHVFLYNSGMTAVEDTLRIVFPSSNTVVFHGNQQYSQSHTNITVELKEAGVKVVGVDLSSTSSVTRALDIHLHPDKKNVFLIETVSNGPEMQVPELDTLFNHPKVKEYNPLVILDNTLPSPIGLSAARYIEDPTKRVVIVESGTKFYGLNKVEGLSGIAYAYNEEVLKRLKERRQRTGSLLHPSAVRDLGVILPTPEEFKRRNTAILSNTKKLAQASFDSSGNYDSFIATSPDLSDHPNYDYAIRTFPYGTAPVFFLQIIDANKLKRYNDALPQNLPEDVRNLAQFGLLKALYETEVKAAREVIQRFCEVGQSFGSDYTRIWADTKYPAVRIAGGTHTKEETEVLANAFTEALSAI